MNVFALVFLITIFPAIFVNAASLTYRYRTGAWLWQLEAGSSMAFGLLFVATGVTAIASDTWPMWFGLEEIALGLYYWVKGLRRFEKEYSAITASCKKYG